MNHSISFFLNQWPLFWTLLALFFSVLGLWWAYLTWYREYGHRLAAAKGEFERLQKSRTARSAHRESTPPLPGEHRNRTGEVRTDSIRAAADARETATASPSLRLPSVPEAEIDWAGLPGIDPKLAGELKTMGIKNPEQLDKLNNDDRSALQSHLQSQGLNWDWSWLSGWKGIATGAGAAAIISKLPSLSLPKSNSPTVQWAGLPGLESGVAQELESMGIQNPEQLDALSLADRKKLETHFQSKGLNWNWNWVTGWTTATKQPTLNKPSVNLQPVSVPHSNAPKTDWRKLRGVDARTANVFDALGIRSVDQLEKMSDTDRKNLERQLAAQGINWDWTWTKNWVGETTERPKTMPQFDTSSSSTLALKTAQQAVRQTLDTSITSTKGAAGKLAAASGISALAATLSIPKLLGQKTDWQQVKGTDPRLVAAFDTLGIQSFDQIEAMSSADRKKLDSALAANGINWDWTWMQNWKADATPRVFTPPEFDTSSAHQTAANVSVSAHATGWSSLPGIDPAVAKELHALGFRSVEELESLPYDERRAWEAHLREKNIRWDWSWILKWKNAWPVSAAAKVVKGKKKFVSDAPPPQGLLSTPMNGKADDLKRVNGIGPVFERILNERGVFHFHQLAAFTDRDVEWMAGEIDSFPDRIDRDNWIEQAKQLARSMG